MLLQLRNDFALRWRELSTRHTCGGLLWDDYSCLGPFLLVLLLLCDSLRNINIGEFLQSDPKVIFKKSPCDTFDIHQA